MSQIHPDINTDPTPKPNGSTILFKARTPLFIVFLILTALRICETKFLIQPLYVIVCGVLAQLYLLVMVSNEKTFFPLIQDEGIINSKKSFVINNSNFSLELFFFNTVFFKLAGMSATISFMFFLFKLLFWSGAEIMGYIGIGGLAVTCFLSLLFLGKIENEEKKQAIKKSSFFSIFF